MGVNLRDTLPGLLKAKRITQAALAEKTGIRRTDINALANGRIEAGPERLARIAAALEVSRLELGEPAATADDPPSHQILDRLARLESQLERERKARARERTALAGRLGVLEAALGIAEPGKTPRKSAGEDDR